MKGTDMKRSENAFLAFCLFLGLVAAYWVSAKRGLSAKTQASQTWIAHTQPHLDWAASATGKCLNDQLAQLGQFFRTAKTGTPQFVDRVLGWGSKWNFLLDNVPFTQGGRHSAFLTKTFEEQIFSKEQLDQAIRQVSAGYLNGIEGIENQMLVKIHQDVKNLPTKIPAVAMDQAKLQAAYRQAISQANSAISRQVKAEVGKELVSLVTAEILTQVTVRLGVSSGILGAGASSSWATLGVGLLVGVAADEAVSWGWNKLADPKGKLTGHIGAKIDELHLLLVEGNAKGSGLRRQLQAFSRERNELRRQAIHSLEKGGDQ
jgi:hypothetical protein